MRTLRKVLAAFVVGALFHAQAAYPGGVVDGQPVNASIVNAAYLYKNANDASLYQYLFGAAGSPAASAQLELQSTTKGFLPPRMTTTQQNAISSPATGLELFNTTTSSKNVYTGSAWVRNTQQAAALTAAGVTFADSDGRLATGTSLQWDSTNFRLHVGTQASSQNTRIGVVGTGENGGVTDSGNKAAAILVGSTAGSTGDGGLIEFGYGVGSFTQPYFAAIKGHGTSSSNNTQGDLVFYTRNASTDSSLTEQFRIGATGGYTFSRATASTVPYFDSTKNLVSSAVTPTELGYVSGVTSAIQTQLNAKQATGNYITALTGDVTASGPGSSAATLATVNSNVGSFGSTTAIPSFTVNGKGLLTAVGTVAVVAPAGTVTGTTLASNVVTSSLTTVGTIGTGLWQGTKVAEGFGGTNQSTYTLGDTLYSSATNTISKLAGNTTATLKFLGQTGTGSVSAAPAWTSFTAPTIQKFTSTGTTTGYAFTVTSANATVGDTYTNNGNTYTVLGTISATTRLFVSGASAPAASGTLTRASGSGDATITFSLAVATGTYTLPAGVLYVKIKALGPGGGGGGAGTASQTDGGAGNFATVFGANLISAGAGGGGGAAGGSGGSGGASSLGTAVGLSVTGGRGAGGQTATGQYAGGAGGASCLGGAGGNGVAGSAGTAGATNSGGGGAGGGGNSAPTGSGGGSGGCVEALITSPAATYPYLVGTGGTAGGAGTSGAVGGAGAAGQLVIEEHYQ